MPEAIAFRRIREKAREHTGQRASVTIWKGEATWPDRLGQAALGGADRDATARDPFQGNNSKRFRPARRHDEDLVFVEKVRQFHAGLVADKIDLRLQSQIGSLFLEPRAFWTVARNGQARLRIEPGQRFEQEINSLIGNQAADEDQLFSTLTSLKIPENLVVERISDANRWRG